VRYAFIDSTIALSFALFINAAILIVAAATFHTTRQHAGGRDPGRVQAAHAAARRAGASTVFALALLASGRTRRSPARSPGRS
jgi:manganese transport protein